MGNSQRLGSAQVSAERELTLEESVNFLASKYHQDPILALKIIRCEGRLYGNKNNINYINGVAWSTDVGPWQINNYFHEATAKRLGLDIYNRQDNLEYGFILMKREGTRPWSASRQCWNK